MILYRIAREKYADKLHSSGVANRWNIAYQYVIYSSENISLCAIELLAHTNGIRPAGNFKIMTIELKEPPSITEVATDILPADWNKLSAYGTTQQIGSAWYSAGKTLCLKVPSAIIPSEYNYILNTMHPDFTNSVRLAGVQDFFWDSRFPEN